MLYFTQLIYPYLTIYYIIFHLEALSSQAVTEVKHDAVQEVSILLKVFWKL